MIINCVDEQGRLDESVFTKITEAASEVFRQEFDLPPEAEDRLEVSLTITDGETIRSINSDFRGIDRVTDVLSFPQYESAEAAAADLEMLDEEISIPLGDVVICYDRACEQAEEYGNTEAREITYLFVHSMMHLLGYDHMEEDEKKVMRAHEESVMEAIDLRRTE